MHLEEDKVSGAAVLTERALTHLQALSTRDYDSLEDFLHLLKGESQTLSHSQRSMVSLKKELSYVVEKTEKAASLEEARQLVKGAVEERIRFLQQAENSILSSALPLIEENALILTHSHSSTVEKIVLHAHQQKPFSVVVTESRPACEGRNLAETLHKNGVPVTLIVDFAASLFDFDIVLVGANAVTPRYVVNKIGTKFLACTFPTYVACSTNKFTTGDVPIEEKDPKEVYEGVPVKNFYFDKTPLDLMKGFITEYGILSPEQVKSFLH